MNEIESIAETLRRVEAKFDAVLFGLPPAAGPGLMDRLTKIETVEENRK